MTRKYQTFREFYPYYLSEHANPVCRTLHFAGSMQDFLHRTGKVIGLFTATPNLCPFPQCLLPNLHPVDDAFT